MVKKMLFDKVSFKPIGGCRDSAVAISRESVVLPNFKEGLKLPKEVRPLDQISKMKKENCNATTGQTSRRIKWAHDGLGKVSGTP